MKYTRYEYDSMLDTLYDCYILILANFDRTNMHNKNIDKIIEIVKEARERDGKK